MDSPMNSPHMKVVRDLSDAPYDKDSIVTVGTFDGVHLGHQRLINTLVQEAKAHSKRSVIVTFDPHPQTVLANRRGPIHVLSSLEEKSVLLEDLGLELMVVIRFDTAFAELSAEDFILKVLLPRVGMSKCLVGYDHFFGRDRTGSLDTLRRLGKSTGFDVESVPPVMFEGHEIKSTRIRILLSSGDVASAARLLGRPYILSGVVTLGNQRGRTLGFPTANLALSDSSKLVPGKGVYVTRVTVDDRTLRGVTNIGTRPTFGGGTELSIETHIVNFDGRLYDKPIALEFLDRLRDEVQFGSQAELSERIRQDIKEACLVDLDGIVLKEFD